jgi:ethanolamine utilization protein EutM
MPKALGLVETRGLVAAIEAADAMIKAANVTIIGRERTDPALITIKIVGDVAAVKSAVDAGAAAAGRVGEVVSIHIIPQPDSQMSIIIPEISDSYNPEHSPPPKEEKKKPSEKNRAAEPQKKRDEESAPQSITQLEKKIKDEVEETKLESSSPKNEIEIPTGEEIIEQIDKIKESINKKNKEDALPGEEENSPSLFPNQNSTISRLRKEAIEEDDESVDLQYDTEEYEDLAEKNLEELTVHELRRLARLYKDFPIQGREISKANKKELIDFFNSIK